MDKLKMHSQDLTKQNIDKIAELFPGVLTEGRDEDGNPTRAIDFDLLKQELSDHVVEGPQERYQLDWPGKREASFAASAPIPMTLRPVREESINFDTTGNLFIEADNLDALKLLQESYLGKVKLIYIDPPYNTGNDFIYDDHFAESAAEYLSRSGQVDEAESRLVANTESNGRFHSDWLSMMLPRLKLARNLLADSGFIVVSVDDSEVANVTVLLDALMGRANRIGVLVWDRNRKNDARYVSVGHEYMLVYARNRSHLDALGTRLKEPQPGLAEARTFYDSLVHDHGEDWEKVQDAWRGWFKQFDRDDERRKLSRFGKAGPRGPFRDDGNINWPGGGGPRYEVLHPETGRPCKLPTSGWRYPTKQRFDEEVASGRIVFGPDDTTVPRVVNYLFESDGLVMGSVHYSYAQTAAVDFQKLMGARVFDNPKNWKDLRRIIEYFTGPDDLVLDFFAGSGSTAHAVLDLNATTGSARRFILVQLDETVPSDGPAAAAGFTSIAEIARDRIRRVGDQLVGSNEFDSDPDFGFRSLRADTSNMADVWHAPDASDQAQLSGVVDSWKPDRSAEDLLFQILLDWGLELTLPIVVEPVVHHEAFVVDNGALIACLDANVGLEAVREIASREPLRVVFRDAGFSSDAARINTEQIFAELSPHTDVKVI
jgi:adenine-specific DNA-methyltransferase